MNPLDEKHFYIFGWLLGSIHAECQQSALNAKYGRDDQQYKEIAEWCDRVNSKYERLMRRWYRRMEGLDPE